MNQRMSLDTINVVLQIRQTYKVDTRRILVALPLEPSYVSLVVVLTAGT
jgi:hypothetical protein